MQLAFLLELWTPVDHFTILARPAIYTANNKRAVISNGQQVPIPGTSLSNVPTTGATGTTTGSVASVESTVQYENVELRLEVIPADQLKQRSDPEDSAD